MKIDATVILSARLRYFISLLIRFCIYNNSPNTCIGGPVMSAIGGIQQLSMFGSKAIWPNFYIIYVYYFRSCKVHWMKLRY